MFSPHLTCFCYTEFPFACSKYANNTPNCTYDMKLYYYKWDFFTFTCLYVLCLLAFEVCRLDLTLECVCMKIFCINNECQNRENGMCDDGNENVRKFYIWCGMVGGLHLYLMNS